MSRLELGHCCDSPSNKSAPADQHSPLRASCWPLSFKRWAPALRNASAWSLLTIEKALIKNRWALPL